MCILHKSYSKKKQDESIISGYLTALNDFSQEIGGQTEELKMENSKLKYKFLDDEALFVFVVEDTEDSNKDKKINMAIESITNLYKQKFPKGIVFNGNTEEFYTSIGTNILDKIMYPLAFQIGELGSIIKGRLECFQNTNYSQLKSSEPFDLDNIEL
ncbi:MAG: hypothetical protein GF329_02060 [Candidatus Lokiarchaeota archaeon]|nr:hypothetical protein [Candidatus Lokiarchaeota archaeon]